MKKQATKRLSLNRETLRAIDAWGGAGEKAGGSITVCPGGYRTITVCPGTLLCGTLPICFVY